MEEQDRVVHLERVLFTNEERGFQYRLSVSDFRGETYINIRKYFLSFDEDYVPSKEGATFPLTIPSLTALIDGLMDVCSKAEINTELHEYFVAKQEQLKKSELVS